MSTAYNEVAACADRILAALGPCGGEGVRIALSGRSPNFPQINLDDLLTTKASAQLAAATRTRLSGIVRDRLALLRDRLSSQYWSLVKEQYSPVGLEMSDLEIENQLIGTFEVLYQRIVQDIRTILAKSLVHSTCGAESRNPRGGFGDRNLLILETAFQHTTTPLSAEIDHLSRLTGLEPHQVRTWFQNKRNRGNKSRPGKKNGLRTASSSHVQSSTQLPIVDGRRVASLPSRKYLPSSISRLNTSGNGNGDERRPTRPMPRRGAQFQSQSQVDVPLARTLSQESHESNSTNYSFSSIPSNGGFTAFTYPSASPHIEQPSFTFDHLPHRQTQAQGHGQFPSFDPNMNITPNVFIPHTTPNITEMDFETYMNFNIDSLAPPVDDLQFDLEAQITAALRPIDQATFNNLTLAPAPSLSPSSFGEGSPLSDLSGDWFTGFGNGNGNGSEGEEQGMEILRVFLNELGTDMVSPIEKSELQPESGMGMGMEMSSSTGMDTGMGLGSRSISPETVASFTLNSARASPNCSGPSTTISTSTSTSNSIDGDGDVDFIFDFEQVSVGQSTPMPMEKSASGVVMEKSGSGSRNGSGGGWMMGVLPFDTMADQVMGAA